MATLRLRGRELDLARGVVMAIVNRTSDSFYAAARFTDDDAALAAVERAAADGAEIVDVGGIRAGRGPRVEPEDEIARVIPFVAAVRERFPDLILSVDTWRAQVAREAARAGADLINDTWAGHDPELAEVAAAEGVGVVVSHTGGALPRTDPLRVSYPGGVVEDVLARLAAGAARAVAVGVDPAAVLIDPTHDFGKNTWHSLELVRHTARLAELGFPVLVALSRKDFVGETLGLDVDDRLEGTLAATAIAAWHGAGVFRAHDVAATRRTLDMVAAIRGVLPPVRAVRGLA
ncbi:MAG: dihydropteroate synthase [Actinomycetota bacterium]|nr:dihydropteroate synthase [Actinomycetota bacterium]